MTNYLEVTNLSKSFDSFQLHNISFTLPKGYIMGLIGPNGSGKTTTIKLILNMLKRTGGTVKVMGLDNIAEEQKVKSELGVVFDTNYFSDDWKVSQVEKSISVFYPNWDSQKFVDMLRKFHIAPTKKVKELSKGMQMKLMLACAFSYDAKLLILDEPTSGLDPVSRDELLKILSEYIEDGEHSVYRRILPTAHSPFPKLIGGRQSLMNRLQRFAWVIYTSAKSSDLYILASRKSN